MAPSRESPESISNTQAVAERLRLTRLAFDMKKATWCRFVGISPQAWNNVEGTETSPASNRIGVDEAMKVCRATGVGLNWIFRGDRADVPVKVGMKLAEIEAARAGGTAKKRA